MPGESSPDCVLEVLHREEETIRNPIRLEVIRQWMLKVERWKDLEGTRVFYRISAPVIGICEKCSTK